MFKVNIRDDASGRWLEQSIRFSVDESGGTRPGGEAVLALMHQRPAHPWTVADLARQSGVSRSVLAERFRHFLDAPPMTYLMGWRLQLGARILCSTGQSVAQVAAEVGYESEPAFNRAFKREFGLPPARFRSQSRPSAAPRKSAKRRH